MSNPDKWSKTKHVWYSMVWRCNRKEGHFFKYYGSRGITVCERWLEYRNFLEDMGEQPKGMTIERIDNDKGYNPENCKWVSHLENSQNKRLNTFATVDGTTLTISEWARRVKRGQPLTRYHYLKGSEHFTKWIKSLQVQI